MTARHRDSAPPTTLSVKVVGTRLGSFDGGRAQLDRVPAVLDWSAVILEQAQFAFRCFSCSACRAGKSTATNF